MHDLPPPYILPQDAWRFDFSGKKPKNHIFLQQNPRMADEDRLTDN